MLLEPGTDHARDVFFTARRVRSSRVLIPEAHAAVTRARRARRIGPRAAAQALDTTRILLEQVEPVELHASIADRAALLASEHGLRGFDAIHLASYERAATSDSVLIAADGELLRAAAAGGYATASLAR